MKSSYLPFSARLLTNIFLVESYTSAFASSFPCEADTAPKDIPVNICPSKFLASVALPFAAARPNVAIIFQGYGLDVPNC